MPPAFVIILAGMAGLVGAGFWLRHGRSADEKTIREMRQVPRYRIADAPGGGLARIVGTLWEGAGAFFLFSFFAHARNTSG